MPRRRKEREAPLPKPDVGKAALHAGIGVGGSMAAVTGAAAGQLALLKPLLTPIDKMSPAKAKQLQGLISPKTPMHLVKGDARHAFYIQPMGIVARNVPSVARARRRVLVGAIKKRLPVSHQKAVSMVRVSEKKGLAVIPNKGPLFGAHEFGHAATQKSRFGRYVLGPARTVGGFVPMASLLTTIAADPDSPYSKYAPLAVAASHVPMLGEEALASWRGLRGMRKARFGKAQIGRGRTQALQAWGTHALSKVPSIALPFLVRQIKKAVKALNPDYTKALKERERHKKRKMEIPKIPQKPKSLPKAANEEAFFYGFFNELESLN